LILAFVQVCSDLILLKTRVICIGDVISAGIGAPFLGTVSSIKREGLRSFYIIEQSTGGIYYDVKTGLLFKIEWQTSASDFEVVRYLSNVWIKL